MKDTVKIVITGHVDHGKSSLIGRLLLDTGSLSKEKIAEIKKISRKLGRDTELAYLVDQLKEERERNITIDTTQIFFRTRRRNYVIIDAPGHVEFIKNMITGASLAEAVVLIVDVKEGIMEQTRRHLYLVGMLGLDNIIVAFNKMDLVDYDEKAFLGVKTELSEFMRNTGKRPFALIPISAKEGVNICEKSCHISWYKGPTLLEALDSLKFSTKEIRRPLRFPVQDIYELDCERIILGRVASGVINEGESVMLLPSLKEVRVKSVKSFQKHKRFAREGESIGLVIDEPVFVRRGDIVAQSENSPKPINRFKGDIFWMSDKPLEIGKGVIFRCATQEVRCIVERIEKRIDSATLEVIEEGAMELRLNEVGVAVLKTDEPVVLEKFPFVEELGRFVIETDYNLQGAGIIVEKDLPS